jgi:DNA-binding response OmpR family regulator
MRVLLVEDDPDMSAMIRHGLAASGFNVDWAPDGKTGLNRALRRPYSVIVLDLMLPQMNGWEVCRELRARKLLTPILMISARDLVSDKVAGLETGADDYLPKPFDFTEFLARIRALIRRDRILRSRDLQFADVNVDTGHRTVRRAGKVIPLTKLEYDIFEILATQIGRTVTREVLLELVWQDRDPGSNKLDVAIRSLRKKLDGSAEMKLIQTVYGFGYSIRVGEEAVAP